MKTAVFVDVQNIYYTTRETYGRPFNYRRFWENLSQEHEIVAAYAYAIDRGDQGQQKFQSALKHIGFELKLKPFIQRADGSAKGDWDVGITIDVLSWAASVEQIVLLSGDGDFEILVDHVQQNFGNYCKVVSVAPLSAQVLIRRANDHHNIGPSDLL
ncbi:NYN domain-containing protein [Alginatibacterium sediminis]|uniref:NYN domain-containing protein n=1 Tax=Alginatibacterium sediminis TaxID=2164068 RepID=A0A420EHX3_9ALTE|nr:NYN domain-containing protein [Alginatibacterium sediminis]RKF20260.1 NYN domain-containing protein [Alginatibacterium sediminis]